MEDQGKPMKNNENQGKSRNIILVSRMIFLKTRMNHPKNLHHPSLTNMPVQRCSRNVFLAPTVVKENAESRVEEAEQCSRMLASERILLPGYCIVS